MPVGYSYGLLYNSVDKRKTAFADRAGGGWVEQLPRFQHSANKQLLWRQNYDFFHRLVSETDT